MSVLQETLQRNVTVCNLGSWQILNAKKAPETAAQPQFPNMSSSGPSLIKGGGNSPGFHANICT